MSDTAIHVASVTKRYDGRTILDRIELKVYRGETLVILGGSGSGKSTLLRLMIGNVRPDEGKILIPTGRRRRRQKPLRHVAERNRRLSKKALACCFKAGRSSIP